MNMTKISMLLASIALTSTPTLVQAYQIAPNPNPVGNTIVISDADAENLTIFDSNGDIVIDGTLTNVGTLNSNGLLDFNGTLINNGILNNHGILTNNGFLGIWEGSLNNYGTLEGNDVDMVFGSLNNYGTMNSGAMIAESGLSNFGILNSSRLEVFNGGLNNANILNSFGEIHFEGDSSINNTGTLNSYDKIHFEDSTFTNHSNGTFNNYGNALFTEAFGVFNDSILNNYGTLTNKIDTNDHSGFYNNNIFTNNARLENYTGIFGSGVFTQDAGETINNGSFNQASLQINGGSVSGTGSFTGDVTIASGASVNPGNSPGTLTFNGDFHSSGNLNFEIAGTGTGLYDVLAINGNADFTGGNVLFSFIDGFHASAGNHWDFLLADSITGWDSLTVSFNGLNAGLGTNFTFDSSGAHLSITPVPEPETYAMLLAGLGLLSFVARRKKEADTTNAH